MTGQRQDGIPIADASAILGLSAEALRKRLNRGTLGGYKIDRTWFVVLPAAAPRQDEVSGRQDAISSDDDAIEARYAATPSAVERAIERTSARYVADFASLYDRIASEVGGLYEAQLVAKDETIAAQRELVAHQSEILADARDRLAELRRRAEAAEAERDNWREEATARVVPPTGPAPANVAVEPSPADAPPFSPPPRPWWRRLLGGE